MRFERWIASLRSQRRGGVRKDGTGANDGARGRKDALRPCEECSGVAVHRDRLSDRAQCLLVCCNYA